MMTPSEEFLDRLTKTLMTLHILVKITKVENTEIQERDDFIQDCQEEADVLWKRCGFIENNSEEVTWGDIRNILASYMRLCSDHLGIELATREEGFEATDRFIKIEGKTFRCSCGCNVFRKSQTAKKYRCNSCNALYSGEKC